MDNLKKRKNDNGLRRYVNPGWVITIILVSGMIITLVSNVKTIPVLAEKVGFNKSKIDKFEVKLDFIIEEVKDIKRLIKGR
jgi:hypothetical protein